VTLPLELDTIRSRRAAGTAERLPRLPVHRLRYRPLPLFAELKRTQGDVAVARWGGNRFFLVSHPDEVAHVLVDDAASYERQIFASRHRSTPPPTVRRGWFQATSDPDAHLRARRALQPVYGRARAEASLPLFRALAAETAESWRPGTTIDVVHEARRAMLRMGTLALFGEELMPIERLQPLVDELVDTAVSASSPLYASAERLRVRRLLRRADAFAELAEALRGRIADRRAAGAGGDDLFSLLARHAEVEPIDEHDLVLEAFGHLFSTADSGVNTLAWTMVSLWRRPEIAERIAAENAAGDAAPDSRPYATAVLHEVLRLYPAGWRIARRAVAPTEVGGRRVEVGDQVWVSQWVVHRDERWWPEPEAFRPERWLEPQPPRPRLAFFPFGAGRRKCSGDAIALRELVVLIAEIASRRRLTLPPGSVVRPAAGNSLHPRGGLRMRVEAPVRRP
jgi:cytochrome P450